MHYIRRVFPYSCRAISSAVAYLRTNTRSLVFTYSPPIVEDSMDREARVVEAGQVWPLEVFLTESKGWGVRAVKRIPANTFVAAYSGEVVLDKQADNDKDAAYLWDLDHFARRQMPSRGAGERDGGSEGHSEGDNSGNSGGSETTGGDGAPKTAKRERNRMAKYDLNDAHVKALHGLLELSEAEATVHMHIFALKRNMNLPRLNGGQSIYPVLFGLCRSLDCFIKQESHSWKDLGENAGLNASRVWKDPASIAEELVRTFLVPFIHCWAAEGKRRPVSECERELDDKLRDLWDSTDHLTIDGSSFGNVTRFINDGGEHGSNLQIVQVCTPLATPCEVSVVEGRTYAGGTLGPSSGPRLYRVAFFTGNKPIEKGEELLYNYGSNYWEDEGDAERAPEPNNLSGDALFVEVHIDDLGEKGAGAANGVASPSSPGTCADSAPLTEPSDLSQDSDGNKLPRGRKSSNWLVAGDDDDDYGDIDIGGDGDASDGDVDIGGDADASDGDVDIGGDADASDGDVDIGGDADASDGDVDIGGDGDASDGPPAFEDEVELAAAGEDIPMSEGGGEQEDNIGGGMSGGGFASEPAAEGGMDADADSGGGAAPSADGRSKKRKERDGSESEDDSGGRESVSGTDAECVSGGGSDGSGSDGDGGGSGDRSDGSHSNGSSDSGSGGGSGGSGRAGQPEPQTPQDQVQAAAGADHQQTGTKDDPISLSDSEDD